VRYLLIVFGIVLLSTTAIAEEVDREKLSFPAQLMESTFKIQSGNSFGTAFVMVHPSSTKPNIGYFVLITAKHVLESFKGDNAILHLRKRDADRYVRLRHSIQIRNKGKPLWIGHPKADVAVMRTSIPTEAYVRSTKILTTAFLVNYT